MTEETIPSVTEETKTPLRKHLAPVSPFIMGLIGGTIAYVVLFLAQTFILDNPTRVLTVDIRKLVEMKRDEILTRYKGSYTSENAKIAETELLEFNNLIDDGLKKIGGGRVVFIKDVVLVNSIDKTDELLSYIKKNQSGENDDRKKRP